MGKKLAFLVCVVLGANQLDLEKEFLENAGINEAQSVSKSVSNDDVIKSCDLLSKNMDYKQAFDMYEKACKDGDYHACFCLGGMYELKPNDNNIKKAYELYTKACNGENNLGCKSAMKLQYGIKF